MKAPIRVRLANDYSLEWPVWFADDVLDDKDRAPLGDSLKAELQEWAAMFNEHFDHSEGWDSPANRDAHDARGRELHDRMTTELGSDYVVDLHLWAK